MKLWALEAKISKINKDKHTNWDDVQKRMKDLIEKTHNLQNEIEEYRGISGQATYKSYLDAINQVQLFDYISDYESDYIITNFWTCIGNKLSGLYFCNLS